MISALLVGLGAALGLAIAGWWTAWRRGQEVQSERRARIVVAAEADRAQAELQARKIETAAADDQKRAIKALNEATPDDDPSSLSDALDRAARGDV